MKYTLIVLCLLPLAAWGVETAELDRMLAATATNQGSAYLLARGAIINLGSNALPNLAQASSDAGLLWQERLLARICYERIARSNDIQSLREYDWESVYANIPKADKRSVSIMGKAFELRPYAVPKLKEFGLWYYYVELTWKATGELAKSQPQGINAYWPWWCRLALDGALEQDYLRMAMIERLDEDAGLEGPNDIGFYQTLGGSVEAVPVLVKRLDAYYRHEVKGPEVYPGSHAVTYRGMFAPIVACADSRHGDLLEKFVADHPVLAELKPKLTEVRARPAPTAKPEPPFRLGTNLVVIAP